VPTDDATEPYGPDLERRIEAMRALLAVMSPDSPTEALQVLRRSFPGAPLVERVAALVARRADASKRP